MKSTRLNIFGAKNKKKALQRAALYFISLVVVFSLAEPGAAHALDLFNSNKKFDLDYDIKPLKSDETIKAQSLDEAPKGLKEPRKGTDRARAYEEVDKRTAYTSTYVNNDGTKTMEWSPTELNFKKNNKWEKINNKLKALEAPAPEPNLFEIVTNTRPESKELLGYAGEAGNVGVEMKALSDGLHIKADGRKLVMKPIEANNVKPERLNDSTVIYRDAWKGVDLEYEVRGESVKEIIVLKNKDVQTAFDFQVRGGKVTAHPTRPGELSVEGISEEFSYSSLTLHVNEKGVISESRVTQTPTKQGIRVQMDEEWLREQPTASFPMKIDPTFSKQGGQINYRIFKSDGFSCNASNCYANIGQIDDGTGQWKNWRTFINFPYNELAGKKVINANLHGWFKYGMNGITDGRYINMGRSDCLAYTCVGPIVGQSLVGTDFDINFTDAMNSAVTSGSYGIWWSLWGEEGGWKSYKPYYDMKVDVTYDSPTAMAQPVEPANKQVTVDTQTTLKVNPVTDADGDQTKYYFRVSTQPDAETGAVINSGWITSPQWNIPDGILQDGTTYYWHTYTMGATQTNPNWVRSFKVDLRTGKDSTQSYDTVGPVGVDLATGNAALEASTHSMKALGGNIGLSFNYDTPNKAKKGLMGEYWNVSSGHAFSQGVPKTIVGDEQKPNRIQREQHINMSWNSDSVGGANADWVYARWKGLFTAPRDGQYTFGANADDNMAVFIDNQEVFRTGYTTGAISYTGSTPVTLKAGQTIPLRVEYQEATAGATAKLYVKGAVNEQIVPREWLHTEPVAESLSYGLEGRYYTDDGKHDIVAASKDPMRLMLARQDTKMNLNFGTGGPAPGMRTDNFMARWTGYITAPVSGTYNLGAYSDDGLRIKTGTGFAGAMETKVDQWVNATGTYWSGNVNLEAGKPVPVQIEWYEQTGAAQLKLLVRGNGYAEQEMPVSWLTPQAQALPGSWKLGIDVDGDVAYERLRIANQSAILTDATGSTHEYTWTGSGYKPPVDEDGVLSKNADNTYTFIDTDGRTYIFDAEGKLTSLTTPTDDRQPSALKYEYAGDPSRLVKITDGVTNTRYGTLHYKSVNDENMCGHPGEFDAAPAGMLCALKTSDGDETRLYYKSGQLVRIVEPGNEITDYSYDNLGRIKSVRDSLAADVVAAGVREANEQVMSQMEYDNLGRISTVKAPAPTQDAVRMNHRMEYLPNATNMHIDDAAEPLGFSKRIEYDNLLRTVKETDLTGKSTSQEWDPVKDLLLSTTDTMGLKSTTIYDEDDKPMENYGPAPQEWYQPNGLPVAGKETEIPRVSTRYDEGMKGLAVAYYASNAQKINKTIFNGQVMKKGETRSSIDHRFVFIYQTDGNLVLYGPNGAIWASNTTGKASTFLGMQSDGNMVLYNNSTPVWATGTSGGSSSHVVVQNDGNMVMYSSTGVKWSTNTGGWPDSGASNAVLRGAPKLFATNISNDNTISKNYGLTSPSPNISGSWGMRMTGKMRLPTIGKWNFRVVSDGGVRVWIDDALVLDDWRDGAVRAHAGFSYDNTGIDSPRRMRIDYYHTTDTASFTLYATPPGGVETANVAPYFSPDYNLTTSTKSHDKDLGITEVKTKYKNPAYGQIDSTIMDESGLNHINKATYEEPGAGFLRQTSKTLPGGGTVNYQHYGVNDIRDNPCTPEVETYHQGGLSKGKVEADPDGPGPQTGRTSESIYNASGEIVATRYNSDPWTCTEYDSRGRISRTVVPQLGQHQPSRTITNNYAAGGNPLITSTNDSSGTIVVETDLAGRTIKYIDVHDNVTTSKYSSNGLLMSRSGPLGDEVFVYDEYDRLIDQKLDGIVYAHVTYDQYSNIDNVTYPAAGQQKVQYGRDILGRPNSLTYTVAGKSSPGPNLVANSSFENEAGGQVTPAEWTTNTWGNNFPIHTYEDTGRTGSKSVKTELTAHTDGDAKWMFTPVAVTGSTNYTYSDYFKSNVWSNISVQYTHQDNSVTWEYLGGDNASSSWKQGTFSFTTPATAVKASVVRVMDRIGWVQVDDVDLHQTLVSSSMSSISDTVSHHVNGMIQSGVENGVNKSYTYDRLGRLTNATIGGNSYAYEFGASNSSCEGLPGNNVNSSKNGNRSKLTVNGEVTTYCYNYADQLINTSDPKFNNIEYDAHGNITRLNSSLYPVYDASDRNRGIEEYDSTGNGHAVYYHRDAQNRITQRSKFDIVNWSWQGAGDTRYGHTASGDTPDFITDAAGVIQEKYLLLAGDVLMTVRPSQTGVKQSTYSLPNIHDDVFATTNADGQLISTHMTGPFGENIASMNAPLNTDSGTTFSYVGQHEKITETGFSVDLIQMGARAYVPQLGRFLSVDPVEGGVDNNYVYPTDPVNRHDLTGEFAPVVIWFVARIVVQYAVKHAVKKAATKGLSQLATNRIKGKITERVAYRATQIRHPLSKVKKQVYYKTDYGKRYADLRVTSRITKKTRLYEVKYGRSAYTSAQKLKDRWIYNNKGYRTKVLRFR